MKNLLIILTMTTLFACSESNEVVKQYHNIDVGIEFSIFNSENEDLLNPENPNHLDVSKIKLFYIINGERKEVYNSNLTSPRNFMIYKHENEYRIRIFLNHTDTSDKPITYIQWNESDTDTIEVTYKRNQNAILKNNVWLNSEKIWERESETVEPYFILIK
jgi:hypothetical protein